jgi:hypothetical protein
MATSRDEGSTSVKKGLLPESAMVGSEERGRTLGLQRSVFGAGRAQKNKEQ